VFSKTTTVAANWKNTLDAFQENYHSRMIHPETGSFVDGVGNTIELIDDHSVLKVPFGTPDQLLGYDPEFPRSWTRWSGRSTRSRGHLDHRLLRSVRPRARADPARDRAAGDERPACSRPASTSPS